MLISRILEKAANSGHLNNISAEEISQMAEEFNVPLQLVRDTILQLDSLMNQWAKKVVDDLLKNKGSIDSSSQAYSHPYTASSEEIEYTTLDIVSRNFSTDRGFYYLSCRRTHRRQIEYFIQDNFPALKMVYIPSGIFNGNYVKAFFMSAGTITQQQWRSIWLWEQSHRFKELPRNPSHFPDDIGVDGIDRSPVESVTYQQAEGFCYLLSDLSGRNYRLPTEIEWEYAARAGTKTTYHFGEEPLLSSLRCQFAPSFWLGRLMEWGFKWGGPQAIHSHKPNGFGLYNVHGNVWEWCQSNDSKGVRRGGGWGDLAANCTASARGEGNHLSYPGGIGFRVVCEAIDLGERYRNYSFPNGNNLLSKIQLNEDSH